MRISQKSLNKLNKWTTKNGYKIYWGDEDMVLPNSGEVFIKSGKYELYALLHECGHISIFNKKNYGRKYKILEKAEENGNLKKTNVYKYQKMMEEIQAWQRGYKLAKSLGIKINKKEYFQEAAKWVGTYRRLL